MVADKTTSAHEIPTSGPKTIKPRARVKGVAVPIATRIAVRNMYLTLGLPHKEIAERAKIPLVTVQNIVARDKLAVVKRQKVKDALARSEARIDEVYREFEDTTARESEEITLGALERAKTEVKSKGKFSPKNFQAWTAGIQNLVKVSRTMRGLDQRENASAAAAQGVTLNMFVVQSARDMQPIARSAPVNTPVIDVQARPA